MKWLKWQAGRQTSDYSKLLLLQLPIPLPFDLYLLKFPTGSFIRPHIDEVKWGRHYRCNVVVKPAARGGEFLVGNGAYTYLNTKFVKIFRSDKETHEVTEVLEGTRYVLSLGVVIPRIREIFRN
jgi:hypothetical protein